MPLATNLMTNAPPPVYRTGKICYLEIPATDISEATDFYHQAFGWSIRRDSDGASTSNRASQIPNTPAPLVNE